MDPSVRVQIMNLEGRLDAAVLVTAGGASDAAEGNRERRRQEEEGEGEGGGERLGKRYEEACRKKKKRKDAVNCWRSDEAMPPLYQNEYLL